MEERIGQQLPGSLALLLVSPAEILSGDVNNTNQRLFGNVVAPIIRRITGSCITSSSVGSVPLTCFLRHRNVTGQLVKFAQVRIGRGFPMRARRGPLIMSGRIGPALR
jgi:hypothetical protein